MGIFSPKDKTYLEFYKQLGDYILQSAKLLQDMLASDVKHHAKFQKQIFQVEENADEIKKSVATWTRNTFITPYDRDEMYRLASYADDIVDAYYNVIDTIYLYQIEDLPKKIEKQVQILNDISIRIFAVLSGFSDITAHATDLDDILEMVINSENERRSVLAKVFNSSKIDPVQLIKTKSLTDSLNEVANAYKSVASLAQMIAIKES